MEQLQTVDTSLVTSVGSATTAAAVTSAFATWRASVQGSSGLLATVLGDTITATAAYTTTIAAFTSLDTTLQASLTASATASKNPDGAVDPTKLSGLVSQAYATFATGVQTAVTSSTITFAGSEGTLMSSVIVTSQGSF
jgi:hypothetical protein